MILTLSNSVRLLEMNMSNWLYSIPLQNKDSFLNSYSHAKSDKIFFGNGIFLVYLVRPPASDIRHIVRVNLVLPFTNFQLSNFNESVILQMTGWQFWKKFSYFSLTSDLCSLLWKKIEKKAALVKNRRENESIWEAWGLEITIRHVLLVILVISPQAVVWVVMNRHLATSTFVINYKYACSQITRAGMRSVLCHSWLLKFSHPRERYLGLSACSSALYQWR